MTDPCGAAAPVTRMLQCTVQQRLHSNCRKKIGKSYRSAWKYTFKSTLYLCNHVCAFLETARKQEIWGFHWTARRSFLSVEVPLPVTHVDRTARYGPRLNGVAKITSPWLSWNRCSAMPGSRCCLCFQLELAENIPFYTFASEKRVSWATTFARRVSGGGGHRKRNRYLKQLPNKSFELCCGNFIGVSGSVSLITQKGISTQSM